MRPSLILSLISFLKSARLTARDFMNLLADATMISLVKMPIVQLYIWYYRICNIVTIKDIHWYVKVSSFEFVVKFQYSRVS
jgi:hypothetical protein